MDCGLKNLLGEPRKGAHALRIPLLDIALVDTLLTIVLAFAASRLLGTSFLLTFIVLLIVAVAVHRALCVDTRLNKLIFGKK
jgi:hypothetical protein